MFKRVYKVVLLALMAMFIVGCGNNPVSIAKDINSALENGDVKVVMKYISTGDASKEEVEMYESKMKLLVLEQKARIEKKGGISKTNVVKEEIKEDRALVVLENVYKDGSKKEERFNFAKVKGDWKIAR